MTTAKLEQRTVFQVRGPTEVVRHRSLRGLTRCGLSVEETWPDEVPVPPRPKNHVNVWTCGFCYPQGLDP